MEKNLKHPLPTESVAALPDIPASEPRVRPAYPEIARHAGSHELLARLTESAITPGHRPPTLPFRARPQRAEWPVDKPRSGSQRGSHSNIKPLDTVIPPPPDGRYPFYDPVYPWSAFGRVTSGQFPTPLISASGVMVGPRHLLTSSRIVGWHADGPTDWLVFTPSYYAGTAPFGSAYAVNIFSWRQLEYLTYDSRLDLMANDYVVVVLDTRIGEATGWLGSAVYNTAWNNQRLWDFVGYSNDFSSGQEPVFQNGIPITSVSTPPGSTPPNNALLMNYVAWMGEFPEYENGGPFFGWWSGAAGPTVIGVQTVYERTYPPAPQVTYDHEYGCGGLPMVSLIQQALAAFP